MAPSAPVRGRTPGVRAVALVVAASCSTGAAHSSPPTLIDTTGRHLVGAAQFARRAVGHLHGPGDCRPRPAGHGGSVLVGDDRWAGGLGGSVCPARRPRGCQRRPLAVGPPSGRSDRASGAGAGATGQYLASGTQLLGADGTRRVVSRPGGQVLAGGQVTQLADPGVALGAPADGQAPSHGEAPAPPAGARRYLDRGSSLRSNGCPHRWPFSTV